MPETKDVGSLFTWDGLIRQMLLVTAFSAGKGFTTCFRRFACILSADFDVLSHTAIGSRVMHTVFDNAFYAA